MPAILVKAPTRKSAPGRVQGENHPNMHLWARFLYLRGDTCRECPQLSAHGPTIGGNHGYDYLRHKNCLIHGAAMKGQYII